MDEALSVLNELQELIDFNVNNSGLVDVWVLQSFIDNQRSIYQPVRGECAV